jgi:hypothetical protein
MAKKFKLPLNTTPVAGIGKGRDGAPRLQNADGNMIDGKTVVERRHPDFIEHQIRWRWLLDSYEGGDRYRNAVYGPDRKGLPCRNLFRHRREYPDPQLYPNLYTGFAGALAAVPGEANINYGPYPGQLGADPAATAQDDDYEMRRSRTPVPEFVAEAVEIHLGKIYEQEVKRKAPQKVKDWWDDVDGCGTPLDDWMRETVAPLLLVLGCIDICLDHPQVPPGEKVKTRADELRLGLDKCVASYILPQNMMWWRLDNAGRYAECLVREYTDPSQRMDLDSEGRAIDVDDNSKASQKWRQEYIRYRHWSPTESVLYNFTGDEVLERTPHKFGRPPIVRMIDQKKHRTPTVGKSRYEAIAELQREYYNRDSELILSDTLQAHPLLSGPEDYCKADNTLSIGPGYVLPKKKSNESGSYEGWEYTSPPSDPADSLRKNKQDLVDMKDRRAGLTKPAGATAGSGAGGGGTVAQSGISKTLDSQNGHKILAGIGKSLSRAERTVSIYALLVLLGRMPKPEEEKEVDIVYPTKFDLQTVGEINEGLAKFQTTAKASGAVPEVEGPVLKAAARKLMPGESDEEYQKYDEGIDRHMERQGNRWEQAAEGEDRSDPLGGSGNDERLAGSDPSGQSAATSASGIIPTAVQ